MRLFELYWSWYEDYSPQLFINIEDKTQEQFESDCKTLMVKYGNEYLSQENSWAGANNWIRFIGTKLPELGYTKVEPIAWGHFGSYIIQYDKEDRDDDKTLKNIIGEDLYLKAVSHNKNLNDEMMRRINEEDRPVTTTAK